MRTTANPAVTPTDHTVIGAGPAGLVAAASLARAGRRVRVLERSLTVGHRFAGDFQGLENWSSSTDLLVRLRHIGVEPTFAYKPVHEVTFYDSAEIMYGPRIGPNTLEAMLCGGERINVVGLDAGEPVVTSRATRAIPPAIRRTVTHRDGGCSIDGCNHTTSSGSQTAVHTTSTTSQRWVGITIMSPSTDPAIASI